MVNLRDPVWFVDDRNEHGHLLGALFETLIACEAFCRTAGLIWDCKPLRKECLNLPHYPSPQRSGWQSPRAIFCAIRNFAWLNGGILWRAG
jgi:hypothetical protein